MRYSTIIAVMLVACSSAGAQETLSEAMDAMPDDTRYRVELVPSDMPRAQLQRLAMMIGNSAKHQHFYGAIYGYRPAAGGTTEYKMRSKLYSRDAARLGARADCEAARSAADSECTLVGEILPEGWSETTPQLSHVVVQALRETAGQLPGNVVVARSRDGDGFEVRSGEDVRARRSTHVTSGTRRPACRRTARSSWTNCRRTDPH